MTSPVLPGATIGFLGGGQLARMSALAARSMGYGVAVLDPDPACAAAPIADLVVAAGFDDPSAARRLAQASDVITIDIERVAPEALRAAATRVPVHPAAEVLEVVGDRAAQKRWLEAQGHPIGPWRTVSDAPSARAAALELGPCRLKRRRGGYDGRGQAPVPVADDAAEALALLDGAPSVAEAELPLALELSVLVARSARGEVAVHPAARNWHDDGILKRSALPALAPPAVVERARQIACAIAQGLGVVGLLAAEFFVLERGELLVNELAPRPHNTFHAAGDACATSQFEQLVRAVCGLPLGDTTPHGGAALRNLLGGEAALAPAALAPAALAVPGVSLHLYGKAPRPNRKVGHLTAVGRTPEEAIARLAQAEARLVASAQPFAGDVALPPAV